MSKQNDTGTGMMNWLRMGVLGTATAAFAALPALALEVSPSTISFDTTEKTATLDITQDGKKLDASAIKSVKLYASGNDYDHMIKVAKVDGGITVTPSESLEIGTYDLVIDTTHGQATASLQAPLDGLYTSIESRAERLGITTDELKARLGLSAKIGDEYIDLNLPKVYFVGQTVKIPIDRTEGRVYAWTVNGDPIQIGQGDSTMQFTFTEAGVYDFAYVESEGGRVVANGFGATSVVPEPAVHRHYEEDTTAKFHGPEGYSHYVWAVDGVKMAAGKVLTHTFDTPGEHTVTVHAHTPIAGPTEAFREVTFQVTVS